MKCRFMTFYILIALIFSVIALQDFATASGHERDLSIQHMIYGNMTFNLTGASGVFEASKEAFYTLNTDQNVFLEFSASNLSHAGASNAQANLDVIYWVNDNLQDYFTPQKSLQFKLKPGVYDFSLHGKVTIDAIEDQPEGQYKGTIVVTVTGAN